MLRRGREAGREGPLRDCVFTCSMKLIPFWLSSGRSIVLLHLVRVAVRASMRACVRVRGPAGVRAAIASVLKRVARPPLPVHTGSDAPCEFRARA